MDTDKTKQGHPLIQSIVEQDVTNEILNGNNNNHDIDNGTRYMFWDIIDRLSESKCVPNLNYKAIMEYDSNNDILYAYSYAFPNVYTFNVWFESNDKFYQNTFIKAPSLMKDNVIDTAMTAHKESMRNLEKDISD